MNCHRALANRPKMQQPTIAEMRRREQANPNDQEARACMDAYRARKNLRRRQMRARKKCLGNNNADTNDDTEGERQDNSHQSGDAQREGVQRYNFRGATRPKGTVQDDDNEGHADSDDNSHDGEPEEVEHNTAVHRQNHDDTVEPDSPKSPSPVQHSIKREVVDLTIDGPNMPLASIGHVPVPSLPYGTPSDLANRTLPYDKVTRMDDMSSDELEALSKDLARRKRRLEMDEIDECLERVEMIRIKRARMDA